MSSAPLFDKRPSTLLQSEWMRIIAETGQPELIPALNHGPISKSEKFIILRRVYIDRKKRPNRDKAPCPMCTKNRFLRGSLIYLHEYDISTVIGHCCADYANEAERQYDAERLRQWQEDYLLAALPHVAEKLEIVAALRAFAAELQRVYRKLRSDAPGLQGALRNLKERNNARLSLGVGEDSSGGDYIGPAGFRGGASKRGAQELDFGTILGTTLLIRDYKPVTELNDVERNLAALAFRDGDEIEFIASLSPQNRKAAVALLQLADQRFAKFESRARDATQFFDQGNITNLNSFGTHHLNPRRFSIARAHTKIGATINIISGDGKCCIVLNPCLEAASFPWKVVPLKPFRRDFDGEE